MRSAHSSGRETGSILIAALAVVIVIFMMVAVVMGRVVGSAGRVTLRHGQATALFLAEAGLRKAGSELLSNPNYAGERGTKMPTGSFDVTVTHDGSDFLVRSTGYMNSAFKSRPKKTVGAKITLAGPKGFRITQWKENP